MPRPQFLPLHLTSSRFGVICAHRRSGKTVAGIAKAIQKVVQCPHPNPRVGIVLPYLKQAKTNAWQYLKQMTSALPERDLNESELKITFAWGNREIRLYGADNPNGIRGGYFDHVLCDEWAFADPSVYPLVIRPMLSDRIGSIDFASTPNGKNHFYELLRNAVNDDKYFTMMLKADTSGLLSVDELEDIRNDPLISPERYAQEYLCSFEAATEGSFYSREMNEAMAMGRIGKVEWDSSLPVFTAWDFGNSDDTVIWFIQWRPDRLNFIDYYHANKQTVEHYCRVVNAKPYKYATHYAPHDIAQFHFGMVNSRASQFKEHGINMVTLPRIGSEMEGINALRSILPMCHFDAEKCEYGVEALKHYRAEFDYGKMVSKDTPLRDWSKHSADAAAQAALAYRSIFRRSTRDDKERPSQIITRLPTFNDFAQTEVERQRRI